MNDFYSLSICVEISEWGVQSKCTRRLWIPCMEDIDLHRRSRVQSYIKWIEYFEYLRGIKCNFSIATPSDAQQTHRMHISLHLHSRECVFCLISRFPHLESGCTANERAKGIHFRWNELYFQRNRLIISVLFIKQLSSSDCIVFVL